jgi:dsDNA-specific endonuclease/ATPase MutS2
VAERGIAFTHGSFVPLRAAREDAGLSYTPISLDLRGVAVLTGPNMGGKSVALATCGFLALCAASGVPPPAQAAAIALFEHVAWIGSDQRADRDRFLSAFGAEVVRARDVLAAQAGPTLVLVDEFARTTGPREGRALLVALIESFARRDIDALVATHFDGVAREAGAAHFAIAGLSDRAFAGHAVPTGDVHAALDVLARAMDYRIVPVTRESDSPSDALAVAALLGLDPPLVERASALFARDAAGPLAEMAE